MGHYRVTVQTMGLWGHCIDCWVVDDDVAGLLYRLVLLLMMMMLQDRGTD